MLQHVQKADGVFSKKWISSFRCSHDHGLPKLGSFLKSVIQKPGRAERKTFNVALVFPKQSSVKRNDENTTGT